MDDFQKLSLDEVFHFACHPGIECFNRCCRDLNQHLTPYDILRLKNRLGLSSQAFLKQHTTCHIGPGSGLPVVSLKMLDQPDRSCPFVSEKGCTVYEDRPGCCRLYPLARVAWRDPEQATLREFHVPIHEPHCLGFQQDRQWTVRRWKASQGVAVYDRMNDLLMDLISLKNRSGRRRLSAEHDGLFYLTCYNIDAYRDYFLDRKLWRGHDVGKDALALMEDDDVALLRFGIQWLQKELFGKG